MPPTPPASSNENAQNNECRYRPAIKNIKIKKSNTKSVLCASTLSAAGFWGKRFYFFFFVDGRLTFGSRFRFFAGGKLVGACFGRFAKKRRPGATRRNSAGDIFRIRDADFWVMGLVSWGNISGGPGELLSRTVGCYIKRKYIF